MAKKRFILVLLITCVGTLCYAQLYNTGDSKLNSSLTSLDGDAKSDPVFKKRVSETYQIPETKVDQMTEKGMRPGDIVMAGELSKITKKPVDDVVKVYETNKEKGWGVIAKELGIKPGSPEFHALKKNTDDHAKKAKASKSKADKSKSDKKGSDKSDKKESDKKDDKAKSKKP